MNFQMFKLDLEKSEELNIKLPTSAGSSKKQESSRIMFFCFIEYAKAFDCVDHNELRKILKVMGIPDHLTCLLRMLYAGQEATVEPDIEQRAGSKLGKEYNKAVYCHPVYLFYMQNTSCKLLGWIKHKPKSKLLGEIVIIRDEEDTNLMAENEEELKSLLLKMKEESEKAGLKLNIEKTKTVASSPITSWKIGGETMETVRDFIFLGSKITADGDCNHEIKRRLLLGRKE